MIKNEEIFKKALETLTENDRKTLEQFAQFLLVSNNKSFTLSDVDTFAEVSSTPSSNLLNKVNSALLKDYVKLNVTDIIWNSTDGSLSFELEGREKPLTFPEQYFHVGNYNLTNNVTFVFVKFRPGTNRIDKVAFDEKVLTHFGKTEGKKRILALKSTDDVVKNDSTNSAKTQSSSDFVQKIVAASSDGWNKTKAEFSISVSKNDPIFAKLDSFKEGRLRLSRVGEILFCKFDQLNNNHYIWDSEFFFGSPHDFTNLKNNKTYDIKCHFHANERLQLSEQTLSRCDADFIVAVLVEEDADTYKATFSGYISKDDFTAKTKPWAYNEHVSLRSLELHELNSPEDLF